MKNDGKGVDLVQNLPKHFAITIEEGPDASFYEISK